MQALKRPPMPNEKNWVGDGIQCEYKEERVRCKNAALPGDYFCYAHTRRKAAVEHKSALRYQRTINDPNLRERWKRNFDDPEKLSTDAELATAMWAVEEIMSQLALDDAKDLAVVINMMKEVTSLKERITNIMMVRGTVWTLEEAKVKARQIGISIQTHVKNPAERKAVLDDLRRIFSDVPSQAIETEYRERFDNAIAPVRVIDGDGYVTAPPEPDDEK